MIALNKCNKLIDDGFSLITIGDNKIPNIKWSKSMAKALDKTEFQKVYDLNNTKGVGIVTGFNFLECIDIDLKVFSTAKEQLTFWNEYLSFLQDNILDFHDKVVIKKTKNAGYHILYKSKRVEGNRKIAKLKGHKEAIIETRGNGGYIFIYENSINDKNYSDIDFITDNDRDLLFSVSKYYDYVEPKQEIKPTPKELIDHDNTGLKCWDDYNSKTSIFDIIGNDFEIVRKLSDKYVIRRYNATSPHSGYVYTNSGSMFLFSTGTIYPAEELITPFTAYVYKNHNGNFVDGAKEIYKKGFGDRIKVKSTFDKIDINYNNIDFPIDIFPEDLQNYIISCNQTLNSSIDYLGCSLIWLTSIMVGNSVNIEVKKGWIETANVWIALIGKAGIGKTPSISNVTYPLMKKNSKEIKKYIKHYGKFEHYNTLDKKEKELTEEIKKPVKSQFIVNDITLEALVDLHADNKAGIGVLKDELAGWFKDMNKYRQGSDLEHWLSSWSGKEINMNRKTAKSSFVERAFIPVLGGIQPSIMDNFYTDENKDNGFIDRMLFSYPELTVEVYNEDEMNEEYLEWYDNYIISMYNELKKITLLTDEMEIKPITAYFSEDAKKEWIRIFNDITGKQNSDKENEYMKSMLPKQKSYIPRFSLLLNVLDVFNGNGHINEIKKESVLKAEKLSNYFISMSKKIKSNSIESNNIKKIINKNEDKSSYEKFTSIYSLNKEISKSKLAETLGISRQQVYNYVKKYEKK